MGFFPFLSHYSNWVHLYSTPVPSACSAHAIDLCWVSHILYFCRTYQVRLILRGLRIEYIFQFWPLKIAVHSLCWGTFGWNLSHFEKQFNQNGFTPKMIWGFVKWLTLKCFLPTSAGEVGLWFRKSEELFCKQNKCHLSKNKITTGTETKEAPLNAGDQNRLFSFLTCVGSSAGFCWVCWSSAWQTCWMSDRTGNAW